MIVHDTASAGSMGAMGMWAGIVLHLLATLMMVLPMAGVDAMDAVPEIGQKVTLGSRWFNAS